jgi:hypothetical protein
LALLHQKFAGAIESKISSGTRVLCISLWLWFYSSTH